jgi:DNA-binding transcriptional LysR family regulator
LHADDMDHLRALRTFVRVIDEGSFARAAEAMDTSPAVVTRLVAELEEHLQARLIHRTTRRLNLTETGQAYLARVRVLLDEIDDADAEAGLATTVPRGRVKVLSPPGFAVHQLAALVPAFARRCPHVSLEVDVEPTPTIDERYDVTIVIARRPLDGGFVARKLAVSEVVLCASPRYLAERGLPREPGDLAEHQFLVPVGPAELRQMRLHARDGSRSVQCEGARMASLQTVHSDMLYRASIAGAGIVGLPTLVVADALRDGQLVRVLPNWRLNTLPVLAAIPTRKHLPARTRAFIDFLVETFGGADRDPWLAQLEPRVQGQAELAAAS